MNFITLLKSKNELLFWFGAINLSAAILFLVLSRFTDATVNGANIWFKPLKFAASIALYCTAMIWFVHELHDAVLTRWFTWSTLILFGFEIIYISLMAARVEASHFNIQTPLTSFMYSMMAFAASAMTIWTGVIAFRFFVGDFPTLPPAYLMAIQWGLVLFVIFAFEGFVMGSRLNHTIGGPDGGPGLPIVGWSTRFGDPRVAHFVGMHALQILPLIGYYLVKDVRMMFAIILAYGALAIWTLLMALNGRPLIHIG